MSRAKPSEMVFLDVPAFFAGIEKIYAGMRDEGREYLTYDEWYAWMHCALDAKLICRADVLDDIPQFPDFESGVHIDWRVCILNTLRRVREAKALGISAHQFHRDERVAMEHEAERIKARDDERRRDFADRKLGEKSYGRKAAPRGYEGAL